jgi:hypothetical protein
LNINTITTNTNTVNIFIAAEAAKLPPSSKKKNDAVANVING